MYQGAHRHVLLVQKEMAWKISGGQVLLGVENDFHLVNPASRPHSRFQTFPEDVLSGYTALL